MSFRAFILLFLVPWALLSVDLGDDFPKEEVYGQLEKNSAQNFCYMIQRKNLIFQTEFLGDEFNFFVKERSCNSEQGSYELVTKVKRNKNGGVSFYSSEHSFDLLTFYSSPLVEGFCSKMLIDANFSNTYKTLEEVIQVSLNRKVDGKSQDVVIVFSSSNKDKVLKKIKYKMLLLEESNDKMIGFELSTQVYEKCPEGSKNLFRYTFRTYLP